MRSLRRVTTAPESGTPGAAPSIPPPYGTNDNVAVGRRFVLVIDQESFEGGRELLFRNAVEGLLGQFAPGDRAMVAALPFGGVRVPFTSDKIAIRQALTVSRANGLERKPGRLSPAGRVAFSSHSRVFSVNKARASRR